MGMAQLIDKGVAESSLRTRIPVPEMVCLPDYSLFDVYQALRAGGARDMYVFLMRLSAKCPLLIEVELDVKNRFRACEAKELPAEDGEPLVLCAIRDWIAVGFPSDPIWDTDRLLVIFNELLPDESIEEASETIDNLARTVHADSICERHNLTLGQFRSPSELWERKEDVFPNLAFGPDATMPPEFLGSVVRRLTELDRAVAEWRNDCGAVPRWPCRVTPESDRVRNNSKLLDARRFRSNRGTKELFEWHARVGNGLRIHIRLDSDSKEIEIGYIGPHLPL